MSHRSLARQERLMHSVPLERNGQEYRLASCALANVVRTYSGVPKAGDPVFMSTLLEKLP